MDIATLQSAIQVFLIFLATNILMTFLVAHTRRHNLIKRKKIEEVFASQISSFLYPGPDENSHFLNVQRALRAVGIREEKPEMVQYLIYLMINTQRALGGLNHNKLQKLYVQIPPYRASITKVRKKDWFQKARGIREIYEMDQKQYFNEIAAYRDHENVYVRREAQIALVSFLGWESLRFLPYLSRKISLWQQIKIVEKLHDLSKTPKVEYLRLGYPTQNPDAIELIIRIIKKYMLISEVDFVLKNMLHTQYEVRKAAIYCLFSFGVNNNEIDDKLVEIQYSIPSKIQQRQILTYLEKRRLRENL